MNLHLAALKLVQLLTDSSLRDGHTDTQTHTHTHTHTHTDTHTHTHNDDRNAPFHRTHHRNTAVTLSNHIQSVTTHVDIRSSLCILSINLRCSRHPLRERANNSWCNYCYVDRTWFKEVLARARLHVQRSKHESLLWVLLGQTPRWFVIHHWQTTVNKIYMINV